MIMENGFCSYPITQQMQSNGRIRFVKIPDNDKYGHYDSLSTRYSDAEDDQLCSHSLAVKFDSLSESMLKQLDTPTMRPALSSLSEMDEYSLNEQPKTTHNEHDGSINTSEGIYTLNGKIPYDNVSQSRSYSNSYMPNIEGNNGDSINYFQDVVNSAYYNIGIEGNLMFRREVPDNKTVRRYNTSYCNAVNLSSGQYQNDANRTLRPGELNTELLCYDSLNVSTLINNTDEHIAGNIAIIAKDQTGCRLLQKMLETEDYLVVETILEGVMDNLVDLMMDPFGNYLCQKLITVCSTQQIDAIIDVAGPMLIDISLNMHGTRTLQRLIEVLHEPKQIAKVTKLLSPSVETLVTDINGNHVIQKCLSVLPPEDCEFIHQAILKKSLMFATHRHGCCVIQRCIDAANTRQRDELVETLIEHTLELIQDPFGNYVVQYILKLKNMDVNARIVKAVAPKATLYAKHKFSSNVIEKCLILTHTRIRNILVEKFVKAPYDTLKDLMLHPFGNYVIQRVLSVAQRSDLDELLKRMRPHIDELRTMSTGKRIAAKITKKHMNSDVPNTKQNGVVHKTNMLGIFNRCDTDDLAAELLRLSNAEKVGSIDLDQVNQERNGQESDVKPPTYSGQQPILTKKDRFSKTGPSIEMLEALFKRALAVQPNRLS
uniref:Pumilio-family RNA binding repeat containing protein n=2 Tax=Babesia bovis TaxID=5865 RepID=A7ATM4_BABBO|eukprot:XP_001609853.1 pumilio-family RNA binding repeat containing protein [Babesia bovis T2Bo]